MKPLRASIRCSSLLFRGGRWLLLAIILVPFYAAASPPAISARAVVIMNPTNGAILYAKDPHRRLPPASTTKVLTTLIALERLDPNARVAVSPGAANTVPSRIGLRAGEALTVQDLLYGIMLKSGNDAAEVVAEAIGGSIAGFAQIMNDRARQIGVRDSQFRNPHGLPDDAHYSSAYDLATIFEYAMRNPAFAEIVRTRNAALRIETPRHETRDWRMVTVHNSNRLLASYEGALGGKTGYTRAAKRCFVGEVRRGKTRLIVAVLGSDQLWSDVVALFDYGFSLYEQPGPQTLIASSLVHDIQREQARRMKDRNVAAAPDFGATGRVWDRALQNLEQARPSASGDRDDGLF